MEDADYGAITGIHIGEMFDFLPSKPADTRKGTFYQYYPSREEKPARKLNPGFIYKSGHKMMQFCGSELENGLEQQMRF